MTDKLSSERKQELCRIMASNLPTLRMKAKLSQNELADRLGFSRQTISAIEGKKRDMQWSTFTAIMLFFSKDDEISQLMVVMGILSDDVFDIDRGFFNSLIGSGNAASEEAIFEGLRYNVLNGAKIINFSLGADLSDVDANARSARYAIEIRKLMRKGYDFLIVQAAGNDRANAANGSGFGGITKLSGVFFSGDVVLNDSTDVTPNIIVVGATNRNNQICSFSNFGTRVDVVAPGRDIYSTVENGYDGTYAGTSMAAPHVAGLAALAWSTNPYLSAAEIKEIIVETATTLIYDREGGNVDGDFVNRANNERIPYRFVDAESAVERAVSFIPEITEMPNHIRQKLSQIETAYKNGNANYFISLLNDDTLNDDETLSMLSLAQTLVQTYKTVNSCANSLGMRASDAPDKTIIAAMMTNRELLEVKNTSLAMNYFEHKEVDDYTFVKADVRIVDNDTNTVILNEGIYVVIKYFNKPRIGSFSNVEGLEQLVSSLSAGYFLTHIVYDADSYNMDEVINMFFENTTKNQALVASR